MKNPNLIIVIGYKKLFAYMPFSDGNSILIKRIEYACDGQTDTPLVNWCNEHNTYQALIGMIEAILDRYQPQIWGLACPGEMCEKITGYLPRQRLGNLLDCIGMDPEEINVANVARIFTTAPVLQKEFA
ncbi:MAG: hypothetical protein H7Y36_10485 [Armatimonadetes bacterium]|nr:hypothetical protein [Akkermansiaceae bacterium]